MPKHSTPEGEVLADVIKVLNQNRIRFYRITVGTFHKRGFTMKMFEPGVADILALPRLRNVIIDDHGEVLIDDDYVARPLWIEVKSAVGSLRKGQPEFRAKAEANGEFYLLARSGLDVYRWLHEHNAKGQDT